jgi:D-serine deaminase-like pyridoxal phosphate-dependent protein
MTDRAEYERLKRAIGRERLPCALVDLDAFDSNVRRVANLAAGKSVRVATKSVRSPLLLRRILDHGAPYRGLMCFAATEAAWLSDQGFQDLLVAYPTVQEADLDALARTKTARIVVDCEAHLEALERKGAERGVTLEAVVDLDVSYRSVGMHLGVRRSPLRSPEDVVRLLERARLLGHVRVAGLMAYEAHVAGLPESGALAAAKRAFKRVAAPRAAELRAQTVALARSKGFELALVNAGGTGSLATTAAEPSVTEVTAGSAFFASHLFDHYRGLALVPSAYFACQVVRASDPGLVTVHGGGWIASGEAGADRLPLPALPHGLRLVPREGAGEVQTPLATNGATLAPGDPVFFRHAKAGELSEHVNELLLVRGTELVGRAPTYRGSGQAFL